MTSTMRNFLVISVCIHLAFLLQWTTARTISLGSQGQQLMIALLPNEQDHDDNHRSGKRVALVGNPAVSDSEWIADNGVAVSGMAAKESETSDDQGQAHILTPQDSKSSSDAEIPGSNPTSENHTIESAISAAIQRRLAAHFSYPRLAKRRGWEGEVRLQVQLESDGRVSDVSVVDSSGYPVLDRSALRAALQVAFIPETSQWLAGNSVRLVIPVHYRLLDS